MSSDFAAYINVYLVDGVTGQIVHSVIHRRAHGPIHVVHSENWIVVPSSPSKSKHPPTFLPSILMFFFSIFCQYSYFNEKSRRTDIAVLELFEGRTQSNTTVFSSLHPPTLSIIEKQAYIFPISGINAMADTVTEKGMTNKHVLGSYSSKAGSPVCDILESGAIM